MRLRCVAAAAIVVVLAGCSSTHHGKASQPTAYPLVSDGYTTGQQWPTALRQGPFHARLINGTACAWVGDQVTVPTEWPAGWTVTFNPTRLHDAAGHVVALDGQQLSLGGGTISVPSATTSDAACGITTGVRVWAAGPVT